MTDKSVNEMTEAERDAYFSDADSRIHNFSYETPPRIDRPKQVTRLAKSDLFGLAVHWVKDGGENNLHYHTSMDEGWMVLRGTARFWGADDKLLGEYGPQEGVFIPAGARYRFEKAGNEDLEILHMIGFDRNPVEKARRYNVEATKDWMIEDTFSGNDASLEKA
ncbi:MAG: cupin domain-containing protein [Proteobacteria bacterium]|nr:cupin domain-containing protein [Pseudomonadota bacterium]